MEDEKWAQDGLGRGWAQDNNAQPIKIHNPSTPLMLTRRVSEGLTGSGQAPRLPFARLYKPPATPSSGSRNVMKPISYAHRPQASWLAREQSCLTADLERDELLHNAGSWSI